MKKTPVIFTGHGSPMLAIDENDLTREMQRVGADVLTSEDRPKAILAISAHWYVPGTYIQSADKPRQIYDMYGFPEELYQLQYPAKGCSELTQDVCQLLGNDVSIDDSWGIDHGTWSVMVHMFPNAPIPVVQLSVNSTFTPDQCLNSARNSPRSAKKATSSGPVATSSTTCAASNGTSAAAPKQPNTSTRISSIMSSPATSTTSSTTKTTNTQPTPCRHRNTTCPCSIAWAPPERIKLRHSIIPAPWDPWL